MYWNKWLCPEGICSEWVNVERREREREYPGTEHTLPKADPVNYFLQLDPPPNSPMSYELINERFPILATCPSP
jgi:hypothetical protein